MFCSIAAARAASLVNFSHVPPQDLLEHPHISSVAVCGISDDEYGQAVGAVVVIKPGAPECLTPADVVAYAKTKMASHAAPRRVVFVQEVPVNAMGKVGSCL